MTKQEIEARISGVEMMKTTLQYQLEMSWTPHAKEIGLFIYKWLVKPADKWTPMSAFTSNKKTAIKYRKAIQYARMHLCKDGEYIIASNKGYKLTKDLSEIKAYRDKINAQHIVRHQQVLDMDLILLREKLEDEKKKEHINEK